MPGSNPPYDEQPMDTPPPPRWGRHSCFNLAIQLTAPFICIVALGVILLAGLFTSGAFRRPAGIYICSTCHAAPMLESISMVSASDGWAVGEEGVQGIIIHYQGEQWAQVTIPTYIRPLSSVFMLSATDGWIVGNAGTILHYDGAHWVVAASPTTSSLTSIDMFSPTNGWAIGYNTILHYDGSAWTTVTPGSTIQGLRSISMASASEGWAVGAGTIAHYSHGIWTALATSALPTPNLVLNSVTMLSSREGWAVGTGEGMGGVIVHYLNGQWGLTPNDLLNLNDTLTAVAMVSPDEGWALGAEGSVSLIMHYTRQSGWVRVKTPLKIDFNSLSMTSPTDGWAVGTQNNFVHYEDGAWC